MRTQDIHHSRFVNKAEPLAQEEVFVPTFRYADLPLDAELRTAVTRKGYDTPTPIQDATIPLILRGKDVVGIANTGTGKTAAFLIPLIQKVRSTRGEQVLIITPTRELAIQIDDELRALTRGMRIFSVVCVGGVGISPQLRALRQQNDFVIGTPGRLKDLIDRKALFPEDINTIVLDEADRMLDMGFINDMREVMRIMPKERQTLFFSATMSPDIQKVIGEFLHNPEQVSVKKRDTSKNVDQDVVHIKPTEDKVDVLHAHLKQAGFEKVLVFGRTKHGVEKLTKQLIRRGVSADSIHGNKNHSQRVRALDSFKQGKTQVLVATDVAARGLDIPSVSHVINYEVPTTYDDYVHRIGRTGRADKKGIALTFIGNGMRQAVAEPEYAPEHRNARPTHSRPMHARPAHARDTQARPVRTRSAQERPAPARRPTTSRRPSHSDSSYGDGSVRRLA
jgi:superfamily II DNA/RNA helicase